MKEEEAEFDSIDEALYEITEELSALENSVEDAEKAYERSPADGRVNGLSAYEHSQIAEQKLRNIRDIAIHADDTDLLREFSPLNFK